MKPQSEQEMASGWTKHIGLNCKLEISIPCGMPFQLFSTEPFPTLATVSNRRRIHAMDQLGLTPEVAVTVNAPAWWEKCWAKSSIHTEHVHLRCTRTLAQDFSTNHPLMVFCVTLVPHRCDPPCDTECRLTNYRRLQRLHPATVDFLPNLWQRTKNRRSCPQTSRVVVEWNLGYCGWNGNGK
jgi:hypothetical protein